jgi:catechol 2,3-dioxygenase-like lactoylglutathione lyase family enzyme
MKRFHVHVAVENLSESVRFYSDLFGLKPTVERPDYAKWMLEDPRLNFAISSRSHEPGVNHLGFQADNPAELGARADQAAGSAVLKETEVECCYAKGNKYWVIDPQGLAWEHFQTLGEAPIFGEGARTNQAEGEACRIPLHSDKSSAAEESKGASSGPAALPATAQARKSGACC